MTTHEFLTDFNGVTWRIFLDANDEINITDVGVDGWATESYSGFEFDDDAGFTFYNDAGFTFEDDGDKTHFSQWVNETYPTKPLWVWSGYGDTVFENDGGVFEDDGNTFEDDPKP